MKQNIMNKGVSIVLCMLMITSGVATIASAQKQEAPLSDTSIAGQHKDAPTIPPDHIEKINIQLEANQNINKIQDTMQENNPTEPQFIPGELIVKFKSKVNPNVKINKNGIAVTGISSIDTLNNEYAVHGMTKIFPYIESRENSFSLIYKLKVPSDVDILSIAEKYQGDPNIEYSEPNYIFHTSSVPNDPSFGLQWSLSNAGQNGGTPDADIDAPDAWNITTGDPNIIVAVIDSGVDYTHPDLAANIWTNTGEIPDNGIDDDGNGFVDDVRGWDFVNYDKDPLDDRGHGTHCSGIISAVTNNEIGIAGVCWNCKIMPVKGFDSHGSGYEDNLISAIYYAADNGAKVISMSWGSDQESQLLKNALDFAYNKGIVLIAAAGNHNMNLKHFPAAYPNVISVSATDRNDQRSSFSNYGSWIDIAAPGTDIYSTMPTYHVTMNDAGYSMNYSNMSGTSMACPHVSGLVGLILAKHPSYTPDEIRTILHSTVDHLTFDQYCGTGRINAYAAVLRNSTPVVLLNGSLDDATVYGIITIKGTAAGNGFVNYSVAIGEGYYPNNWTIITTSMTPVVNDMLATIQTDMFTEGIHSIQLSVCNVSGVYSEDRMIVTIDNTLYANANGPYQGYVDEPVQFHGSAIGGIPSYSFEWDFGDNTDHVFEQNPRHTYTIPGNFLITLRVNDSQGNIAYDYTTATIDGPLTADANGPYQGYVDEPVQFQGSAGGGNPPYSFEWDFGDGTDHSFIENPQHSYDHADTFTATLTVTDQLPQTDSDTAIVVILASHPQIVYVDDDFTSSTPGWGIDHFNKIQQGINAVTTSGTVSVASGIYTEQLTIDKTINLVGENQQTTIIDCTEEEISIVADSVQFCGFTIQHYGLFINSENNTIYDNTFVSDVYFGIQIYKDNNQISRNTINMNTIGNTGIYLKHSSYNTITKNNIWNGDKGIVLILSDNNNFFENNIVGNNLGLVTYVPSNNNFFYHNNFINNVENAYDEDDNRWYNLSLHQGNYWDTFDEPSEGAYDNNNDGIVDSPYSIDGGSNQDLYPLMHPFILGDMNIDHVVDFKDINPFVLALSNPTQYQIQYSMLPSLHGDINQDGVLDFKDINPFVAILSGDN